VERNKEEEEQENCIFYQFTLPKFAMHIVINVNFSRPWVGATGVLAQQCFFPSVILPCTLFNIASVTD
jgi:hypothetical protein